jgi:hypothetical protein
MGLGIWLVSGAVCGALVKREFCARRGEGLLQGTLLGELRSKLALKYFAVIILGQFIQKFP